MRPTFTYIMNHLAFKVKCCVVCRMKWMEADTDSHEVFSSLRVSVWLRINRVNSPHRQFKTSPGATTSPRRRSWRSYTRKSTSTEKVTNILNATSTIYLVSPWQHRIQRLLVFRVKYRIMGWKVSNPFVSLPADLHETWWKEVMWVRDEIITSWFGSRFNIFTDQARLGNGYLWSSPPVCISQCISVE